MVAGARDRIIEAALDLISRHGLSAVTMVEVARTAGVARATLYNHYPDVPSILADAASSHNEAAVSGLHQALAVAASPTDTIEQLVRYIAAISSHGHTMETHHGLPPDVRHQLSVFADEVDRQIERALSEGTGSGEFRSTLDLGATTKLMRHMLIAVSELVAATPENTPHIVADATRTILASITHRPNRRE